MQSPSLGLNENDPRAILERSRYARHAQILAINMSFNHLLTRFPPPPDWREKYALLERAPYQEEQEIEVDEEEAAPPPLPPPPPPPKTVRLTRAARRRSENTTSISISAPQRKPKTTHDNVPEELLMQLNHYPELRRRQRRRRKLPVRRSTGDMVDWLILSCAKEGRRRRTWEEKGKGKGKGKVCLGRNVDRGNREGWRGGRSMRDARG